MKKKVIYKYELSGSRNITQVTMPKEAQVLSVGAQNGSIVLWALVPEEVITGDTYRYFRIYPTGLSVTMHEGDKYIGTVQIGGLVFHVFELSEDNVEVKNRL